MSVPGYVYHIQYFYLFCGKVHISFNWCSMNIYLHMEKCHTVKPVWNDPLWKRPPCLERPFSHQLNFLFVSCPVYQRGTLFLPSITIRIHVNKTCLERPPLLKDQYYREFDSANIWVHTWACWLSQGVSFSFSIITEQKLLLMRPKYGLCRNVVLEEKWSL